jgi:hypothetical protein
MLNWQVKWHRHLIYSQLQRPQDQKFHPALIHYLNPDLQQPLVDNKIPPIQLFSPVFLLQKE